MFIAYEKAEWHSHFGKEFGGVFTIRSNNRPLWFLPKGVENVCPCKTLHRDVYSSFTHNCPNLEGTKTSFRRRMQKQAVVVHPDVVGDVNGGCRWGAVGYGNSL